jgi:hypothetical protein
MDWKFFVGLAGSIAAFCWSVFIWAKAQSQQRAQEDYSRKEKLYRELLISLSAFYKGGTAAGAIPFLDHVRLAWLYAPDDVVDKLYAFLDTQRSEVPEVHRNAEGQRTMAVLVAAIREDLFKTVKKESRLTASDFKHLTMTNPPPASGTWGNFGSR